MIILILYVTENYLPVTSNLFKVACTDGCVIIDKVTYDILTSPNIPFPTLNTSSPIQEQFRLSVPAPLIKLGHLFKNMSFAPESLEQAFSCFNVMLLYTPVTQIVNIDAIHNEMLLTEAAHTREVNLMSMLNYDEIVNPDNVKKQYFLYLSPTTIGGVAPMPTVTQDIPLSIDFDNPPTDYHFYLDKQSEFVYLGFGQLVHKSTGYSVELDDFDDKALHDAYDTGVLLQDNTSPESTAIPETIEPEPEPEEELTEEQKKLASLLKEMTGGN